MCSDQLDLRFHHGIENADPVPAARACSCVCRLDSFILQHVLAMERHRDAAAAGYAFDWVYSHCYIIAEFKPALIHAAVCCCPLRENIMRVVAMDISKFHFRQDSGCVFII